MADGSLEARILELLREVADTDEVVRNLDVPLYTAGLLDSLATVTLMASFAEEFGVDISPAEFDRDAWATPRLVVADILRRAGSAKP